MHLCKPCRWHAVSWLFLHFRGFPNSDIFLKFLWFFLYWFIGSICHCCRQISRKSLRVLKNKLKYSQRQRTVHVFLEGQDWGCTGLCFFISIGQSVSSSRRTFVFCIYFTFVCCCESVTFLLYIILFFSKIYVPLCFTLSFVISVYSFI